MVLTVSVAVVPEAIELGLSEHFGDSGDDGCTEQVSAMSPLNPLGVMRTVEVADAPGLTGFGVSAEVEIEKGAASWNAVPRFEAPPNSAVP